MIIVFDFDGVLAEYQKFEGHDKFGKPISEMIELVKRLYERGCILKLSTTRLNPYPFGKAGKADMMVINGKAQEFIEKWLESQGILACFTELTGYKPYGDFYIDDKGLRYSLEHDKFGGRTGAELYELLLADGGK